MNDASSEAKNYLARELGNHQRFLYEYGYVQIVDILAKGGFLCIPKPMFEPEPDEYER